MNKRMLSSFSALLLCFTMLAGTVYGLGTAAGVMLPLMKHYAPPEDTRLPAEEYALVVNMITSFLRGEIDTFQHIFTIDGTEYAAFNQKEQHHMADVQDLFRLCRWIGWCCGGVLVLLGLALRKNMSWRTFRSTLVAILGIVTAVIVLACIDFNSLFVLFHKVAFTNDLWLLNPQTDLLIRLMPIEFFISYAAIIGGSWLLGMAVLLVYATCRIKKTTPRE